MIVSKKKMIIACLHKIFLKLNNKVARNGVKENAVKPDFDVKRKIFTGCLWSTFFVGYVSCCLITKYKLSFVNQTVIIWLIPYSKILLCLPLIFGICL